MPFQLSPGVQVVEKDFTSIVPAVATSTGAFAGAFQWGPVLDPVRVSSENELVARFGRPTDANADSFFTAANFLSYSNNMLIIRGDANDAKNAVALTTGVVTGVTVIDGGSGYSSAPSIQFSAPQVDGGLNATGQAVISGGPITAITLSNAGSGYTSVPTVTITPALGDTGVDATAVAQLSGAGVTGVTVTDGGSGYTTATVTFSAPQVIGGTTATGTATIDAGVITEIVLTNPGLGYTEAPTVTITGDGINATATTTIGTSTITGILIVSGGSGYKVAPTVTITNGGGSGATVGAVTIGTSSITNIVITNAGSGYSVAPSITFIDGGGIGATATATIAAGSGIKINNEQVYLDNFVNGEGLVGEFAAKYPGTLGNGLKVSMADSQSFATWVYRNEFDTAPGTSSYAASVGGSNDELHIIVLDEDGRWTGIQNGILEKFAFVSKASDAKKFDGANNYYKDVVNTQSDYIWWMDHPVLTTTGAAWGQPALNNAFRSASTDITRSLVGGQDDLSLTDGQLQNAWDIFRDDSQYDISLIPLGKVSTTVAAYVINNVAETRLDCVVFVSPQNLTSGDIIVGSGSNATNQIIAYRNALPSTSYAVMDTGFKYQYDRYGDKYRWIPLNGDIAGLCARTDFTNDPWFSPGGLNRGQVKNVVKLAHNPNKTDRDELYKSGVNPVVAFPGQGTVLFGDKTLLSKPSAFDRINVRRLFIVLEKAIATAAKFQLFEFNDGFTRAQFKNLVEPFLRDVQGRRGVTEFLVKCDESNNTGEVIDRNEFVADIFIKPNRSINFITLNFVAARSSVNFNEIGG
jgi:phage tail sheath protein FI